MNEFLKVCEVAARAGGQVLLDWRGKINAREKGPKDLVTEADLAAQEVVQATIRDAFPNHHFVGEEDGQGTPEHQARQHEYCWICDPLDGTTNYVHQLPGYCVSLALRRDDELVVGVVYDPATDECFTATSGGGAFLNGKRIEVSSCTAIEEALVAVSLPPQVGRDAEELQTFLDLAVASQAIRRLGSAALNLAYLAAGRLDGYWATSTKIWDVAAGVLLVQEAGGHVSGSRGGPFRLGEPGLLTSATGELHHQLEALVTSRLHG